MKNDCPPRDHAGPITGGQIRGYGFIQYHRGLSSLSPAKR
jgi:hypothetical protein